MAQVRFSSEHLLATKRVVLATIAVLVAGVALLLGIQSDPASFARPSVSAQQAAT